MKWRLALSIAVLAAVAAVAVSAVQARQTAGTIDIGYSGDKSGPTVGSQQPVLDGLRAYFKMVNDAGGVNGQKINMIEMDDQFSVPKELENVKSLINDSHVVLVTGIGNSSGFASIVPVLSAAHVPGFVNQGTLKSLTWPFQPWMFEGNCNYADQSDVALAYVMARLKLKTLKGVSVGIAGIAAASGQEWIDALTQKVSSLGGNPVAQTLPVSLVNADTQAQAFQSAGVKFVLMHHAVAGGIALLRSMAKYGFDVPVSGPYSVTQDVVFTSAPYEAAKNFVGVNCYTPPALAKTALGKLAASTAAKDGLPETEYKQMNFSLGWVNAQIITQALKNVKGAYTGDSVRKALETIKNLDTGGLSPTITLSPKCHIALQQARPYTYNWKQQSMEPIGSFTQWSKYITNQQAAPGTCGKPRGSK